MNINIPWIRKKKSSPKNQKGICPECEKGPRELTQYYQDRLCDACIDQLEQWKLEDENDRLIEEQRMREGL